MGKKGGTSWLTAVKRAFRSPSKDDEEKKREKRRWIFRKLTTHHEAEAVDPKTPLTAKLQTGAVNNASLNSTADQKHALSIAVAAAEAAVATAQAAAEEVARLTRPTNYHAREHRAAIVIQTAFRGYLGRRALHALKGIVKLQALVRGYNVRKQAKTTLRCMQALVRVQARVLDQRQRLSHEGSRKSQSAISDLSSALESQYLQEICDRRSVSQSRNGSSIADYWDERERTISRASSQQKKWSGRSPSMGNDEEFEEGSKWLNQSTGRKPWENRPRASTDQIKILEIDTSHPYSYLPSNLQRINYNQQLPNSRSGPSALHRPHPITPSPSKTRPLQVRSASPRCVRDEKFCSNPPQTPSLRSNYYYQSNGGLNLPNYMAATESAKARVRSQSAPRQRPATPERERSGSSARKRLSYPDACANGAGYGSHGSNLRRPSFKGFSVLEQQSNYSSCCTESFGGGEISPSSTGDLRRWLK